MSNAPKKPPRSRTTAPKPRRKKARPLKFLVQPTIVVENPDGTLEEMVLNVITVTAADWPTYATEKFPADLAELEDQLNQ